MKTTMKITVKEHLLPRDRLYFQLRFRQQVRIQLQKHFQKKLLSNRKEVSTMKLIDHRTKETIYEAETSTMRKLVETAVAERKELYYADLHEVNLIDANIAHAELAHADLSSANLSSASLSYANLSNAGLSDVSLSRANLSGANLSYANLTDAYLPYANFSSANLSRANLSDVSLLRANLSGANLSYADLSYADLSDADLSNTDLSDADLSYVSLYGTNLKGANLRYAKLAENVTVKGSTSRLYTAITSVGSRCDTLHLFNTDVGIFVKTGCFSGTVDKFMAKVESTHSKTRYAEDYAAAIAFAKQYFKE